MKDIAIIKQVSTGFEATIDAVKASLAANGFGILCEIAVSDILKKKLAVDYPQTVILGACNPPFALQALTAEPLIAVLLPCNVVVGKRADGVVEITAINPLTMAKIFDNPKVLEVATAVDVKIRAALDALA